MKKAVSTKLSVVALAGSIAAGCASPLTSSQSRQLAEYEARGLVVQEKSTGGATAAGLLPGGGSWYTGHYGPAVANTLLWPASILWDPVSGYNGARTANYFATVAHVEDLRNEKLDELDEQRMADEISEDEYMMKRRRIREKY
ncbi:MULTISPECIES: hypothetical protein [Halomonadaceae]|uniref:Lipoprotein n=1 Tax=Vreelandella halophila TaxID=86177 RepID=A0A9X5B5Q0_9GAMM|nr:MULTISPECIES: hypothetical protein [Halomonas]MYL27565.1 hypothetical protein [Halomonas utahensis]MYL74691.1 hypothetical protein [Halomonas sp. 22501_18_FS]